MTIKVEIEYDDRSEIHGHRPRFRIVIEGEDERISKERLNKLIDTIQEVLF